MSGRFNGGGQSGFTQGKWDAMLSGLCTQGFAQSIKTWVCEQGQLPLCANKVSVAPVV